MTRLTIREAETLASVALAQAGFPEATARPVASALVAADRDGLASHGLARLPFYLAQARSGKVRADALPTVEVDGAVVRVDAGFGLAFAAVEAGCAAGADVARRFGVAVVVIGRSHHFGVAGQPVERLADEGLIALAVSNTPAAMAPWGGRRALFGTNPLAFAAPRAHGAPLVVDLSLSEVARGKVVLAAQRGDTIPEGWALDRTGRPTTDPTAALAGTMRPTGGAKGSALALVVELLAAGLTGGRFAFEASSFFDADGPPPEIGHFILVLDPARFGTDFAARAEVLLTAVETEPGARLPGARRLAARGDGIDLPDALVAELTSLGHAEEIGGR